MIVIAVEVACEGLHAPIGEDVVDEGRHKRLVVQGPVEVDRFRRPVDHRPAAGIWRRRLLQVVPVLDDPAVLEAEDIEADPRAEEVVVGVREDKVAVFEHADRIHPRRQIVLDVFARMDHRSRTLITRLDGLEQVHDHLFTRRHASSPSRLCVAGET